MWCKSPSFATPSSAFADLTTTRVHACIPAADHGTVSMSVGGSAQQVELLQTLGCTYHLPLIRSSKPSCRGAWNSRVPTVDSGQTSGTPGPTTIIICTKSCAHRYISRVRLVRVLIFMYQAKVGSLYNDGRSCPICTRCFHRCSARIPTITSIVVLGLAFCFFPF